MKKLRQLIAVFVCVGLAATGVVSTSFADHDRDSKGYKSSKNQHKSDYEKIRHHKDRNDDKVKDKPAPTPVPVLDGAVLYNQYCSGCHGFGMRGESVSAINSAIRNNDGGMGSLRSLTSDQLTAISQY